MWIRVYRWLSSAVFGFLNDECMSAGAGIAYYTIFSLPPLLVIVFYIASASGVSEQTVNRIVKDQIGLPLSPAEQAEEQQAEAGVTLNRISSADEVIAAPLASTLGPVSKVIGVLLLVLSASGTFGHLQAALNRVWEVAPDPDQSGILNFLTKRLLTIGMIAIMGFLLLVSLVLTTLIDELVLMTIGEQAGATAMIIGKVTNTAVSLVVATLLFAALFRFLPDAKTPWKDLFVGGFLTAVLFVIGKNVLGAYLQQSDIGNVWGSAAASMIGVLAWVYYSALIVLFGAELTACWTEVFGAGIRSDSGAHKVQQSIVKVEEHAEKASVEDAKELERQPGEA